MMDTISARMEMIVGTRYFTKSPMIESILLRV